MERPAMTFSMGGKDYPSAIAWKIEQLRLEADRRRAMGLEPNPWTEGLQRL